MKTNWKIFGPCILAWSSCLCLRLISQTVLADTVPLLAIQQTIGSVLGLGSGIVFSLTQFLATDLLANKFGIWTIGIAGATICASLSIALMQRKEVRWWHSIVAILIYDCITGLCMGPLLWHQPLARALVGQIPHTLAHVSTAGIWWLMFHTKLTDLLQNQKETNEALMNKRG